MTSGQLGISRTATGAEREVRISMAARIYIGVVVLAAVAAMSQTTVFVSTQMPVQHRWVALAVLMALFLICDSARAPLTSRQTKWSPSSSATLAAAVLLGPGAAGLVGAMSLVSLRRRLQAEERLFNAAMHALAGMAAGRVYLAIYGSVGLPLRDNTFRYILLAFAVAAAVHVLANHGLLWGIYRLTRSNPILRTEASESGVVLLLASDLGYASLGLVIAALWHPMEWFAAVIVLVPLFVARWAMAQFAE